jgi:hypothetical protein
MQWFSKHGDPHTHPYETQLLCPLGLVGFLPKMIFPQNAILYNFSLNIPSPSSTHAYE